MTWHELFVNIESQWPQLSCSLHILSNVDNCNWLKSLTMGHAMVFGPKIWFITLYGPRCGQKWWTCSLFPRIHVWNNKPMRWRDLIGRRWYWRFHFFIGSTQHELWIYLLELKYDVLIRSRNLAICLTRSSVAPWPEAIHCAHCQFIYINIQQHPGRLAQ